MEKRQKRLPEAELTVMLALWEAAGPVPRSWLEEKLSHKRWSATTINTYLSRLAEKGMVTVARRGNANLYAPAVARADYLALENDSFLEKLYANSLTGFVAALFDANRLDKAQIDELEAFLQQKKGEG